MAGKPLDCHNVLLFISLWIANGFAMGICFAGRPSENRCLAEKFYR
ncbi:hypothetical protein l11_08600 [Neisseria weaveri LMG 5135]|nr:hypothetical protein l11_08600 [Neisseria weaveri LMG 5135]